MPKYSCRVVSVLLGLLSTAACGGPAPSVGDPAEASTCRTVQHELGTACVPDRPLRIVSLDPLTVTPTLIELGAPVVASAAVYAVGSPFPAYLSEADTADLAVVGSLQEIDLEAVAAADPDLIIGAAPVVAPLQAQLEALAPTVAIRYTPYEYGWRDDVRLVAETVGALPELEDDLAALDERTTEVAADVAATAPSLSLTRVDVFDGQPLYYRMGCTWFGQVLTAAGITQPATQGPDDCTEGDYASALVYLSLEDLGRLDADVLVAYQQQAAGADVGASPLAVLQASPLGAGLPAVTAGRTFVLGDAWGVGGSVASAHQVLDDLEDVVLPTLR